MGRVYLKYLWAVLRHKWFVFLECLKVGLVWRGLIHDWTKFLPDEFIPYARFFYGQKGQPKSVPPASPDPTEAAFILAWNKHQKRHDHHWQFWLLTEDNPEVQWRVGSYDQTQPDVLQHRGTSPMDEIWTDRPHYGEDYRRLMRLEDALINTPAPLPMSDQARKEMLADWRGAGRAYGNDDTKGWYLERQRLMEARLHPETLAWVEEQLGIGRRNVNTFRGKLKVAQ